MMYLKKYKYAIIVATVVIFGVVGAFMLTPKSKTEKKIEKDIKEKVVEKANEDKIDEDKIENKSETKEETKSNEVKSVISKETSKATENKSSTKSNIVKSSTTESSTTTASVKAPKSADKNTTKERAKKKVWVVDKPAWTETKKVPVYEDVLKYRIYGYKEDGTKHIFGIFNTYAEVSAYLEKVDMNIYPITGYESHWETKTTYTTKTIRHEEIGHWE